MPEKTLLNPLALTKLLLWTAAVALATWALRRRSVSPARRAGFLIIGVLVFGFAYGSILIPNPNPLLSLRNVFTSLFTAIPLTPFVGIMLAVLLLMVVVSNKSICGWGCQLGLLQDLIFRIPLPVWRPPFWLTNTVRALATTGLLLGLLWAGADWIRGVDPFRIFSLKFSLGIGVTAAVVLTLSAFMYRPWCQFLCPFGFVGWIVEQVSLLRPRINRDKCRQCRACVRACPTGAMADFYAGKRFHADCFACGACLSACPQDGALGWQGPWEARKGG